MIFRSKICLQSAFSQAAIRVHKKNRLAHRLGIIFCVFLAWSAYSDIITNRPTDLVAFFKKAISSPPDVEMYVASQRSIPSGPINYFSGARAGSNYLLKFIPSSNAVPNLNKTVIIVGRSGTDAYQVGQNNVSYGIGSNPLSGNAALLFRMTRQFLNMGITEIESETVSWEGNAFTAKISGGYPRYGELSISNGLPTRLAIGVAKGSQPYKLVEYTYPNPLASLYAFPSKMIISGESNGELKPSEEVVIYSIQLAKRPLSDVFFAPAQFLGISILHTNIYSNSDLYVENRRGRMVKLPDSVKTTGGYTNSHARSLIVICLVLTTIVPIVLFILLRNQQTKSKN